MTGERLEVFVAMWIARGIWTWWWIQHTWRLASFGLHAFVVGLFFPMRQKEVICRFCAYVNVATVQIVAAQHGVDRG